MVIEDGNADGKIDAADALLWRNRFNPPLRIPIVADTDGRLWRKYIEPCGTDIICQYTCYVTPQVQIIDQGGVTVDDGCSHRGSVYQCVKCGFSDSHVRAVLTQLLGAQGCGEAAP